MKTQKVSRGIYFLPHHGLYIVGAPNFNNPHGRAHYSVQDWVAVETHQEAHAISHGKRITMDDVLYVHNTKKALLRVIEREWL